jgi:tetratricopeptide (TPR) repeat protein
MTITEFGPLLRECRQGVGFSQKELGQEIPLHGSMISRFESGTSTPDLDQLQTIVTVLARHGASQGDLDHLKKAFSSDHKLPATKTIHTTALLINQVFERLSPEETGIFRQDLEDLVDIERDYFRARQKNSDREWARASDQLALLEEPLEKLVQRLRLRHYEEWGSASYNQSFYREAIRHYQRALQSAQQLEEIQDTHIQGELHLRLGDAYRRLAEWKQAQEHYENASVIFEDKDERRYADSLRKIAGTLLYQGWPGKALALCQESLSISEKIGYEEGRYKVLQHEAWIRRLTGQWDTAVELLEHALNLIREMEMDETNRKWELLKAHIYLGDAYRIKREIDKAIEAYVQAEDIIRELEEKKRNPTLLCASVWTGLGIAYRKKGQSFKAKQYLDKSLEHLRSGGEDFRVAIAQNELGQLLAQMGEYQQAEHYLKEASFQFNRVGNDFHYANSLVNLCEFYYGQGRFDKVDKMIEEIEEVERRVEKGLIEVHLTRAQLVLGKKFIVEGNYLQAAQTFCVAIKKAVVFNERFFSEVKEQVEDSYDQLIRARKYDAAITLYETCEAILSNSLGQKDPLVGEFLEGMQRQKAEIESFIQT